MDSYIKDTIISSSVSILFCVFIFQARCADCGELRALRLPALKPVCLRSVDQFSHAGSNQTYNKGQPLTFSSQNNASFSPSTPLYRRSQRLKDRSLSTMEVARAVEEDLPSYYEHLSISLLVPESPEEAPSPNCRRKPLSPALPLPDHMAPIGEFLDSLYLFSDRILSGHSRLTEI